MSTERRSGAQAEPVLPRTPKAGVGLHLTSLPGPSGIGDVGDAALAFVDTLAAMRLSTWQFLPTGPTAYGDSPYQPLSAFAANELLVGLEPLVRMGLLEATELEPLAELPRDAVDYGRVIPAKRALLERAVARFPARAASGLKADYEDFLHANDTGWLADYALFRILKRLHGERPWPEWKRRYAHRHRGALRRVGARHQAAINQVKLIQFLFHQQWLALRRHAARRGVQLFGDLPIYIALDSADAWADRELLRIDRRGRPSRVAGVPPDYFSADGQLWGNPLYDWDRQAADSYRWWTRRVGHALAMCERVRIDHFRGFEAYWSVPFGAETARQGAWEPGPGDALFEAMEAALGRLGIVAEDLGVITAEVDALRRRHGIPGMRVLQFDIDEPDFDPAQIEPDTVCYTGTHDNDTTRGWYWGHPGDPRSGREIRATRANALRLTGGAPATIHRDLIRLAFATPARLAIAPMQDFLGLGPEARFNVPGSTHGNWRWRLRAGQLTPAFIESVAGEVESASRS